MVTNQLKSMIAALLMAGPVQMGAPAKAQTIQQRIESLEALLGAAMWNIQPTLELVAEQLMAVAAEAEVGCLQDDLDSVIFDIAVDPQVLLAAIEFGAVVQSRFSEVIDRLDADATDDPESLIATYLRVLEKYERLHGVEANISEKLEGVDRTELANELAAEFERMLDPFGSLGQMHSMYGILRGNVCAFGEAAHALGLVDDEVSDALGVIAFDALQMAERGLDRLLDEPELDRASQVAIRKHVEDAVKGAKPGEVVHLFA